MKNLILFLFPLSIIMFSWETLLCQGEAEMRPDGIAVPALTTLERNAITSPVNGQIIFNETNSHLEVYDNLLQAWKEVGSTTTPEFFAYEIKDLVDENTVVGTYSANSGDFISLAVEGIVGFNIRRRVTNDLVIENTSNNLLIGDGAGAELNNGTENSIYGTFAGTKVSSGEQNTFIGHSAGRYSNASFNTAIGYHAGENTTNLGISNTFVGHESGVSNTNGSQNTFVGQGSGESNTTGIGNSIMGAQAGQNNTASNNSFFGNNAGNDVTSGGSNTMMGAYAGSNVTTGNSNVYLGYQAGNKNSTGFDNVYVGYRAGESTTTRNGNRNVYIGNEVGRNKTESDRLRIDNQGTSDPLIFGNFSSNELTINGSLETTDGSTIGGNLTVDGAILMGQNIAMTDGTSSDDILIRAATNNIFFGDIGNNNENVRIRTQGVDRIFVGNSVHSGRVGINTTSPDYTLDVNVTVRGANVICGTSSICSDIRFKNDIFLIESPLDKVLQLKGYTHYWKKDKQFSAWGFGQERQLGFIAQEVQKIVPEIVKSIDDGYLSVEYSKLTPLLVEAIKEQQELIRKLEERIENLESSTSE